MNRFQKRTASRIATVSIAGADATAPFQLLALRDDDGTPPPDDAP